MGTVLMHYLLKRIFEYISPISPETKEAFNNMDRWTGRVAVVTGASAGIGACITSLLAEAGMKVVGCARNIDKIPKGENITPIKCDVSKEDEIKNLFETIEKSEKLGKVDVFIANAGLSDGKSLMEGTFESWNYMTQVNVVGLSYATQLAVKSMLKAGVDDGQIIFVNSMSGHRVPNGAGVRFYSATKFAVTALTEGWRCELRSMDPPNHIRVCGISPGLVETEFVGRMSGEDVAKKIYGSMAALKAEDIAQQVQFILSTPARVQVHDILMRPTEQKM